MGFGSSIDGQSSKTYSVGRDGHVEIRVEVPAGGMTWVRLTEA